MKENQLNPHLLRVPLYIAGKSAEEARRELGLADVLKLASNENPLGPSPMAMSALLQALAEAHRYPGPAEFDMRRRLAAHHDGGLTEDNFVIGNGGTDVLRIIGQAFIFDGGESIFSRVTFPLFRLLTTMYAGVPVAVEPTADYAIDLEAMATVVGERTRVVWLCSPNNPTGLALRHVLVESFLDGLPESVVTVLDESYVDYVDDPGAVDSLTFVRDGRPVIAVRSFSKSAGLANLRIGYGVARADIIEYLQHAVLPFNTGAPVVQAAMASLDDHEYHARSRALVAEGRRQLSKGLSGLGFRPLPSQANFVLVPSVPDCAAVVEGLLHRGVIVRPLDAFGLTDAFRVSVGLPDLNERFLRTLADLRSAP